MTGNTFESLLFKNLLSIFEMYNPRQNKLNNF